MSGYNTNNSHIKNMTLISMCVAFIAVCAWICIPFAVNFTLQTLAIFVICSVFGLKISFFSILIYILIGICGLPVFSGFGAGFAVIFGPTGGYLLGFIFIPLVMHCLLRNNKQSHGRRILAMLAGISVCYLFGTLWYYFGYSSHTDISFVQIISVCVLPFIVPDLIKIFLAAFISERLLRINKNIFGG